MFRSRSLLGAVAFGFLAALAQAQDTEKKEPDDILQSRDGTLYVGKILEVTETGVEMQLKAGGKVTLEFKKLAPYSVYRVKADRIDPASAQAHYDLGEYCLANGYYSFAVIEFDKASALDADIAEKAKKKRDEAYNEDARTKFEEAKRLIAARSYEEAEKLLSILLTNYRDTPWSKEAQAEMVKVADEIRRDNELKKKQLEDKARKKAEDAAKKVEDSEKALLQQASAELEEARKQWNEGLDWETKPNLTKAERAFKAAEERLVAARRLLERVPKTADADIAKQAQELDREVDRWLLRTYYRLGRMYAAELNYIAALEWINKGLRLSPDDELLNGILLTLTQLEMRRRVGR